MRTATDTEIRQALSKIVAQEPRVVVAGNFATPWRLLRLLIEAREHVRLFALNPQSGWPTRVGVTTETPFVGPGVRGSEALEYLPARLSLVPRLFASSHTPDVVLIHTSTPHGGKVSLGIEVNILPAAISEVRKRGGLVLAQVNPRMPYTFGDAEVLVEDIDLSIEVDEPLASPEQRPIDETAQQIGQFVSALARDGATLQMGIGQLPNATLAHLGRWRGLRVWSEMISDGVMNLETAGRLDPNKPITATFLFGSPELYAWADRNSRLEMRRTEVANNPARIAEQTHMFSVNTAVEVDLYAQANASYVRGKIYSGFGGQPDFVSGALRSRGGRAIMALRSWHEKSSSSTIVPLLQSPVCSFQHSAVVTEHGVASLLGMSQTEQANELINNAAHPAVREHLQRCATEFGLT